LKRYTGAAATLLNNVTVLVEQGVAPNITLQEVREPASLGLLGIAAMGLALRRGA